MAKVLPPGTWVEFVCPGLWCAVEQDGSEVRQEKILEGTTVPPLHDDKAHIRVPGESHGYWIDWADVRPG